MAFQSAPKVRRNVSPLSGRTSGPLKATLSFTYATSSNYMHTHDLTHSNSAKQLKRSSPDKVHANSPVLRDRHSPMGPSMTAGRRAESHVEALTTNCYLRGEWPKSDPLVTQAYFCPSNLTVDKASQTPEEWCNSQSWDRKKSSRRSASVGSGDCLKHFKARLAKTSKEAVSGAGRSSNSQRRSPVCVVHHEVNSATLPAKLSSGLDQVAKIGCPRSSSHGSLDGLNQEVEGLVLSPSSGSSGFKSPSDGRRAPVAQEFKSRSSALTQTPPVFQIDDTSDTSVTRSVTDSSTEYGSKDDISKVSSSPVLASFTPERLPPDGCEKVCGKFFEKSCGDGVAINSAPLFIAPAAAVFHIPSEKSAFFVPSSVQRGDVHQLPKPLLCKYTNGALVASSAAEVI